MKLHRFMFSLVMLFIGFWLVLAIVRWQWDELPILAAISAIAFGVALWNEKHS